jgi:hypothetical protein
MDDRTKASDEEHLDVHFLLGTSSLTMNRLWPASTFAVVPCQFDRITPDLRICRTFGAARRGNAIA